MAKRLKIDYKKLLQMVDDGIPQKEIMEQLGIKAPQQFQSAYLKALIETGQAKKPVSSRGGRKSKPVSTEVEVNKRGTLTIPKNLIEWLNLKPGDKFNVRKYGKGLSLKRVETEK